jgi:hypothetical protein
VIVYNSSRPKSKGLTQRLKDAKVQRCRGLIFSPEEKKQLPSPKADWDDLDDEIPF